MHGDAARGVVESRQESGDFILASLAKNMKTPRTVFAAAPGEKYTFHGRRSILSCRFSRCHEAVFAAEILTYTLWHASFGLYRSRQGRSRATSAAPAPTRR